MAPPLDPQTLLQNAPTPQLYQFREKAADWLQHHYSTALTVGVIAAPVTLTAMLSGAALAAPLAAYQALRFYQKRNEKPKTTTAVPQVDSLPAELLLEQGDVLSGTGRAKLAALTNMVYDMCDKAGLGAHETKFIIRQEQEANAHCSVDRNGVRIMCSAGLFDTLSLRELRGVMAHEIAHAVIAIENPRLGGQATKDITRKAHQTLQAAAATAKYAMLNAALFSGFVLLAGLSTPLIPASIFSVSILALGTISTEILQQRGILRHGQLRLEERRADILAIRLSRDPLAMANALIKLEHERVRKPPSLIDKLLGQKIAGAVNRFFDSHPQPYERVKFFIHAADQQRDEVVGPRGEPPKLNPNDPLLKGIIHVALPTHMVKPELTTGPLPIQGDTAPTATPNQTAQPMGRASTSPENAAASLGSASAPAPDRPPNARGNAAPPGAHSRHG